MRIEKNHWERVEPGEIVKFNDHETDPIE
jgi:hypothetical protein